MNTTCDFVVAVGVAPDVVPSVAWGTAGAPPLSRPAGRKPSDGRSTRKTASRAASPLCGGGSIFLICDAWTTWLGEDSATPAAATALLKTMEGVNWQAAPEPKKPRLRK